MKKILVTGSKGVLGTVLCRGLTDYLVTGFDLPEHDARNIDDLKQAAQGHDAIVHLAWNTHTDNAGSMVIDADNTTMYANVLRAALEAQVPRVILASSVHAAFIDLTRSTPLSADVDVSPNNPYGAHKVAMEQMAKEYAARGLEVICARFGGVTPDDSVIESESMLHLSHQDLVSAVRACIETSLPERSVRVWVMSKDAAGQYDMTNPIEWLPVGLML